MNNIETELKEINEQQLDFILRTLSPELWKVHRFIKETKVDPDWLCRIMRAIERVQNGIGYGRVGIDIRERQIRKVDNTETDIGVY